MTGAPARKPVPSCPAQEPCPHGNDAGSPCHLGTMPGDAGAGVPSAYPAAAGSAGTASGTAAGPGSVSVHERARVYGIWVHGLGWPSWIRRRWA